MLSATMAVLCCLSLAAADPMSSSGLLAGHPSEPQAARHSVAGTLQIEFECCNGPQSLGHAIISAFCRQECEECPAGQCPVQAGVAQSAECQCVARCKTTALGHLLQAAGVYSEPAIVQPACPGGHAVIGISGVTATLNCESPSSLSDSICGDGGEACPWVAEGACHVRDVDRAANGPQSVQYVVPQVRVQAIPPQPHVNISGFVVQAPPSVRHDVLFSAPLPPPPAFVVSGVEWNQQPQPPMAAQNQIGHLHEAARHLEAAGLLGEAQSLRQRAQEMEHHARRLLEEKEAQLHQLQHEIEALRHVLGHESPEPQSAVSIHSEIIRISPQGLQALRDHGHGFRAGAVNRHEFQQVLGKLREAGMAELVANPHFMTTEGRPAAFTCRLASNQSPGEMSHATCNLSIRSSMQDGCCRLEVQPQMRTTTNAGIHMETAQLTAELDPSQGLLAQLTDDGSLIAFMTWERAAPPQPTAAVPPPVSTQSVLVPASAQIQRHPVARFHAVQLPVPGAAPQSGQIIVQPVFPQPFPTRTPQCPADLQSSQPPIPTVELEIVPPSPVR